jgi:pterin-4a-carbinolamine dehydratase
MDQATLDRELQALPGWTPIGDRIVKGFDFDGFRPAMKFVGGWPTPPPASTTRLLSR